MDTSKNEKSNSNPAPTSNVSIDKSILSGKGGDSHNTQYHSEQLSPVLNSYMDILVLDCINKQMLQRDISKKLGVSKARISQLVRHLKALSLIEVNRVGIINELTLSSKGRQQLSSSYSLPAKLLRIHNQEFKIPLKEHIKPVEWADKLKIQYKMNKLKGHIDIIFTVSNILYRLTPNNLIIHPKDVKLNRNADLLEYYQHLRQEINVLAGKIEESGLHLQRFDRTNYKFTISKLEIAFENDNIAVEKEKEDPEMLILYDREDGKKRFAMDWSIKDYPEAEFFHPQKAIPDAMNWQESSKEFKDKESIRELFTGDYKEFKIGIMQDVKLLMSNITLLADNQSTFAKNLAEHVEAIRELRQLASHINKMFSTAKAEDISRSKPNVFKWKEVLPGVEVLEKTTEG